MTAPKCSINSCHRSLYAKDLCSAHYQKQLDKIAVCVKCGKAISRRAIGKRCRKCCYTNQILAKISYSSSNRNYSDEQKAQIRTKKKLTFAKKYGFSSIEEHDLAIKVKRNLRARLNKALSGSYKTGSAVNELGCSVAYFKSYIESKFEPGMTWNNYGKDGWQVDHIRPLCLFNLQNAIELKDACYFTNMQPLWVSDNLEKRKHDGTFTI